MSKKTEQARFTKVATDLLVGVRDLVKWGMDTGNTTPEMMRLTVAARQEAAKKLVEGGMSQRQAAKVLGVGLGTVQRDLNQGGSKNDPKRVTGTSPATKERRGAVAASAAAEGVTSAPVGKYRVIYADPPWDYAGHDQPDYQSSPRDYYALASMETIC